MYKVEEAKDQNEIDAILQLRYKILRQPWNQPIASATDEMEFSSVNAFIRDEQGNVIACGRLQGIGNGIGQIRFMAVDHHFQGKKLGKKIVEFLEDAAKKSGYNKIELQARENALAFYKSCGYAIREKSHVLWGIIQHYLMEKTL